MTENKLRRIVTAFAVAGTCLLMFLIVFIVVQLVQIGTLNSREEKLEKEISELEQVIAKGGTDLEYYESEWYLQNEAWKLGFVQNPEGK